jgi:hypothetical protein
MVTVYFSGPTEQNIKVIGKTTKCTGLENSSGPMEEFTKVNTQMTKSMVKESIRGPMEECIMDDFITASSMVKASIAKATAKKFMVSGRKARKTKYSKTTTNSSPMQKTTNNDHKRESQPKLIKNMKIYFEFHFSASYVN